MEVELEKLDIFARYCILLCFIVFTLSGVMNVFKSVIVYKQSMIHLYGTHLYYTVSTVAVFDSVFLMFQICLVEMNSKNTMELHCQGMKHLKVCRIQVYLHSGLSL